MNAHDTTLPRSIADYLDALRGALAGADPALIQDALSDAESHLRAECAARPDESEESVLREILGSYGSPVDVAAAYVEADRTVQAALAPPRVHAAAGAALSAGALRRFFAVFGDVRSWTCLMLMLLSLFTGVLYFCIAIIGVSLSLGLSILIIGIPVFIAFIRLTRVLAIVEGRLVEAMTGERMPRRVQPATTGGWLERIGAMLRDLRTWTTLAYQLLALPLGVVYFSVAVTLLAFGVAMFGGGIVEVLRTLGLDVLPGVQIGIHVRSLSAPLMALVGIGSALFGALVLTLLMHLARWVGHAQGKFAKKMLVTA